MVWQVALTPRAKKQAASLPQKVRAALALLMGDMEAGGPVRGDWPNYGKLSDTKHHCHIRKGKTCYVAVWEVTDKTIKLIEVQYVGTHECAPY